MAKEYIERESVLVTYKRWLTELVHEEDAGDRSGVECCIAVLEDAPAADVVEVVRCKECRHSEPRETYLRCVRFGFMSGHEVNPNGFCSYGERKRR